MFFRFLIKIFHRFVLFAIFCILLFIWIIFFPFSLTVAGNFFFRRLPKIQKIFFFIQKDQKNFRFYSEKIKNFRIFLNFCKIFQFYSITFGFVLWFFRFQLWKCMKIYSNFYVLIFLNFFNFSKEFFQFFFELRKFFIKNFAKNLKKKFVNILKWKLYLMHI